MAQCAHAWIGLITGWEGLNQHLLKGVAKQQRPAATVQMPRRGGRRAGGRHRHRAGGHRAGGHRHGGHGVGHGIGHRHHGIGHHGIGHHGIGHHGIGHHGIGHHGIGHHGIGHHGIGHRHGIGRRRGLFGTFCVFCVVTLCIDLISFEFTKFYLFFRAKASIQISVGVWSTQKSCCFNWDCVRIRGSSSRLVCCTAI